MKHWELTYINKYGEDDFDIIEAISRDEAMNKSMQYIKSIDGRNESLSTVSYESFGWTLNGLMRIANDLDKSII